MNDFKKTVDLSERLKKQEQTGAKTGNPGNGRINRRRLAKEADSKKAEGIDKIYMDSEELNNNFNVIEQPVRKTRSSGASLSCKVLLSAILILFLAADILLYIIFASLKTEAPAPADYAWCSVELVGGDVYYGQIGDKSADPIVLKNAYYNYDQINPGEAGESKSNNLRLVKRGQETHGPEGDMEIIRGQVKMIEELSEDSKVLKAILEYER